MENDSLMTKKTHLWGLPRIAWVAIVWVVLVLKVLWLNSVIASNNMPFNAAWIWAPTLAAAALISWAILRDSSEPEE